MDTVFSYKKIESNEFDCLQDTFTTDMQVFFEEFINRKNDIYAVKHEDSFIGHLIANYTNHFLPNETKANIRVYLSHFFLKREYRNNGIGSKLLNFAINDLVIRGFTEFTTGVEEKNDLAKHIYSKFGFSETIGRGSIPCEYTLMLKTIKEPQRRNAVCK